MKFCEHTTLARACLDANVIVSRSKLVAAIREPPDEDLSNVKGIAHTSKGKITRDHKENKSHLLWEDNTILSPALKEAVRNGPSLVSATSDEEIPVAVPHVSEMDDNSDSSNDRTYSGLSGIFLLPLAVPRFRSRRA